MSKIIDSKEFLPQKRNKKLLTVVAIVVALILVAAAVYMVFGNTERTQSQFEPNSDNKLTRYEGPPLTADNPLKPLDVVYEQLSEQELINKVAILTATQQYAEAEKLIKTQNNYSSSSLKLVMLANMQLAQKKNEDVVKTVAALEKIPNLKAGELRSLGQLYSDIDQNQKAVDAFKKAIKKYEEEKSGNYKQEVDLLEKKIEGLQ